MEGAFGYMLSDEEGRTDEIWLEVDVCEVSDVAVYVSEGVSNVPVAAGSRSVSEDQGPFRPP